MTTATDNPVALTLDADAGYEVYANVMIPASVTSLVYRVARNELAQAALSAEEAVDPSDPLQRFDQIRSLLDEMGWETPVGEGSIEFGSLPTLLYMVDKGIAETKEMLEDIRVAREATEVQKIRIKKSVAMEIANDLPRWQEELDALATYRTTLASRIEAAV